MKTLKFKTNIKCMGCTSTVSPFLNKAVGEDNWQVDLQNPDKVLSVVTEDHTSQEAIVKVIEDAGFKAEKIG